ncbi:MAG: patatin family protein [Clostridia bacterium]|nr:patatin family protein [Clostridia bacterium]
MIGVIDVGGGERAVYGAGVFDRCLDLGIEFDCLIGVSAGAANQVSFLSRQRGRNYISYTQFARRKEYMSWHNFITTRNYLNLDYIYSDMCNRGGEDEIDFEALKRGAEGRIFEIIATDANTGRPVYFSVDDMAQDEYGVLKCTCNLPIVNGAYKYKGKYYFDGGLSNPIPIERAFEHGCDKVVVILTKKRTYRRNYLQDALMAILIPQRPMSAASMARRAYVYNSQMKLCEKYEREGRVLIVAPEDTEGMLALTKDPGKLERLYNRGLRDAEAIRDFVSGDKKILKSY